MTHVMLDVGTNNKKLIWNFNYKGLKVERIVNLDYDLFISAFV